jgi:hypothetical protein
MNKQNMSSVFLVLTIIEELIVACLLDGLISLLLYCIYTLQGPLLETASFLDCKKLIDKGGEAIEI